MATEPTTTTITTPSLTSYGTFTGDLFLYASGRAAFESPSAPLSSNNININNNDKIRSRKKKCILVGGLSDGLIPTPSSKLLEECCIEHGFSLVQPILSSSYLGFGYGSLDQDVQELQELMEYLQAHRSSTSNDAEDDGKSNNHQSPCQFCLVGHSTGSQDIVHFLKQAQPALRDQVRGAVLQAPVSDREYPETTTPTEYAENLALAQTMRRDGRQEEFLPRSCHWAPITARRFLDLHERGGADDYFSSDYSDDELAAKLGHVLDMEEEDETTTTTSSSRRRHVLVAYSGADQYVAPHVNAPVMMERLVKALNSNNKDGNDKKGRATGICIANADHSLKQPESAGHEFVANVAKILEEINKDNRENLEP